MKPLMVAVLLSAFSTVALAKTASIERLPDIFKNMVSVEAMQESTGSIGAMREREYFEPPQSPKRFSLPFGTPPVRKGAPGAVVPAKVTSRCLTGERAYMTCMNCMCFSLGLGPSPVGLTVAGRLVWVAGGLFGAIFSATRPEIAR